MSVLQVSSALVYLTFPFVLSWSILEAIAAECLVIGSRTSPVEEVLIDGENGVQVDFFSHEEIADRVVDALANPGQYNPLRQRARQTVVDNYDLQSICLPAHINMLKRVINSEA